MKNLGLSLVVIFILISSCNKTETTPWLNSYNILWTEQSLDASESMPLMGGDIGCNVWVEDNNLLLYIQRSGSMSENGEYLKMGRFRIQLKPNPFADRNSFQQELKLEKGYIEIISNKDGKESIKIKLWVDVYSPVVHIEVESAEKTEIKVAYESWRTEEKNLAFGKDRFGAFGLEGYPGKVIRAKDNIEQTENEILFYHRNPKDKLVPEVYIKEQGLEELADRINDDLKNRTFGGLLFGPELVFEGTDKGIYQGTPYKSWKLKSKSSRRKHHVLIATHIEQTESIEHWKDNLLKTANQTTKTPERAFKKTVSWWKEFWNRSYIFILPENPAPENPVWQMGRNYQLFRYQLGGNANGEYPTKFNGGNLIYDPVLIDEKKAHDPDWRQWGGAVFTAQNQRLLYWPMLKSGDFDVILPQFELYRKGLPGATARVKKHFGHDGAVYCEYTSVSGIPFGDGWGWRNAHNYRIRGIEIPFGDPRANAATGFNDQVEEGVMANGAIAYHWESQIEHAYMILEYHRFTGADISNYMPFIKQSLIFFDEHYRARQKLRNGKELDENGKLVIYPSTSCESYRGAKNPADVIAGLKACLTSILELDDKFISKQEKTYYHDFLDKIPEFDYEEVEGLNVIKPAESWIRESNQELPQFYPLFPFNQFKLGDKEIQLFKNTYEKAPSFRKGKIMSWHQDGIQFARMGMKQEAAEYNTKKLQDSPRRYPTFWGPGHDWVPDHNWGGSGMIGLQEMLMQTIGNQIMLFPAWPKNWDVNFKLHAPHNTIVEAELKNGKITFMKITPEYRSKDMIIMLN